MAATDQRHFTAAHVPVPGRGAHRHGPRKGLPRLAVAPVERSRRAARGAHRFSDAKETPAFRRGQVTGTSMLACRSPLRPPLIARAAARKSCVFVMIVAGRKETSAEAGAGCLLGKRAALITQSARDRLDLGQPGEHGLPRRAFGLGKSSWEHEHGAAVSTGASCEKVGTGFSRIAMRHKDLEQAARSRYRAACSREGLL